MSTVIELKGVKCTKCSDKAVVRVRYAKLNLCAKHFLEFVENRVVKFTERYGVFNGVKSVLLALSGGKDSSSLARIMVRKKDVLGLESIYGLHIDLGIEGFSNESRIVVEKLCRELGLNCIILDLKQLIGYTLPELVKLSKRPACSLCGLLKRHILNAAALELNVNAVVFGHHLDDLLVFALKNLFTQQNLSYLKLKPVAKGIPGLLSTKLKVLFETYEDELELYAKLSGLTVVQQKCPYKHVDVFQTAIRDMLNRLENEIPGFKISLIRRLSKQLPEEGAGSLMKCSMCGAPSMGETCSLCRLTSRVFGKPLGLELKLKIREYVKMVKEPQPR